MAGTGYRNVEPVVGTDGEKLHSRIRRTYTTLRNDWLVSVIVAHLTQHAVLFEERPDTLIAHPECNALPAPPAVDLEIDHRTIFPFVPRVIRGPRPPALMGFNTQPSCHPFGAPHRVGAMSGRLRDQGIAAP